jgi:hypothetical protein
MRFRALIPIAVAAAGCAGGGTLKVTKVAAAVDVPANVVMYVDVKDQQDRPVAGLTDKNFRVYEDGKLVTTMKGKRALLDTKLVDVHYVLLLVDLSGPVVDSEDLPELLESVGQFIDQVGATHDIAVGAFDGADAVAPYMGFGSTMETKKVLDGLRKFRPRTRNTNLNGAVYQGLHSLRDRLKEAQSPNKSAALVVFTDRGELANSVSPETLKQGMKETPADIYVIAAGEKIHRQDLTTLGRSGAFLSNDPKAFKTGFRDIAQKLTATTDGRYVFSYCSPKRRGTHRAEVEVVTSKARGRAMLKFNAEGFTAGCSPRTKPVFEGEGEPADSSKKKREAEAGDSDS